MNNQNKNPLRWFIYVTVILIIIISFFWIRQRFENEKPTVEFEWSNSKIGAFYELPLIISDRKSGVRKVWVGLVKRNKEVVLYQKDFSEVKDDEQNLHEISILVKIEPKKLGIGEGQAILRLAVRDCSWRRWFHGNLNYIEKDVIIDTRPPIIQVLTRSHNIAQGGAGLAVYRLSEPCMKSGVCVGDNFFPGYSGFFEDKNIFMAFFALKTDQELGTKIYISGTDQAGNTAGKKFSKYIKKKGFKKAAIKITDEFLNRKMPDLENRVHADKDTPLVEQFVTANNTLRADSLKIFEKLSGKTEKKLLWNGAFLRLPKAAGKAAFGVSREYNYNGRVIDNQIHLGMDLASVKHAPIPAANAGRVIFAEPLNIYGNTVVIDHGFGLMSIYSHLSKIEVAIEQGVSKGEIIGRTGETGLVGGDHLHFAMFIHNTFVNPLEWWDASWIKNNITGKIKHVKSVRN